MPEIPSELLTPEEVASVLRMSPETVRRMCREGIIRAVKVGKMWRISPDEAERLVREGVPARKAVPVSKGAVLAGGRVHPGWDDSQSFGDPEAPRGEVKASSRSYGLADVRMVG